MAYSEGRGCFASPQGIVPAYFRDLNRAFLLCWNLWVYSSSVSFLLVLYWIFSPDENRLPLLLCWVLCGTNHQREQDFQVFSEFLETVIPQTLYMPGQAPRTLCIGRVYRLSLFYREENRLKRVRNPIPRQVALFKLETRFTHFLIQWLPITAARAGRGPWIARSMQFTLWPSLGRSEIVRVMKILTCLHEWNISLEI